MAKRESGNPSPQNTPLGSTARAEAGGSGGPEPPGSPPLAQETVEVTDPAHPLYGLTLPLLGIAKKQYLGRVCVVWLHPGVERLVPVAATNLAGIVTSPSPCRLSVAAIQALVAAVTGTDTVASLATAPTTVTGTDSTVAGVCVEEDRHASTTSHVAAPTRIVPAHRGTSATESATGAAAPGTPPAGTHGTRRTRTGEAPTATTAPIGGVVGTLPDGPSPPAADGHPGAGGGTA